MDEEQFGPVLPVIKYSDPEDALARANASPYGLGASVWSSNPAPPRLWLSAMEAGHGMDQQAHRLRLTCRSAEPRIGNWERWAKRA